jgi:uroporphyrin-III C-methyltransferase
MTHLPAPDAFAAPIGQISLIGAGPGAADLLTLRAIQRLQAADIVFFDRLIDPEVLDIIPKTARQVNVGKEVGRCKWPQARIDAAIVMAALKGLRVVRLKSGDPSIFGRAGEEIAAAQAQGIPVEVIPGVTAASAAAASCLRPLTERGRFDRVLMLTATAMTGDLPEDFARAIAPGTRLAIYMGVHLAAHLQSRLLAAHLPPDTPVMIAQNVSTAKERQIGCCLSDLAETITTQAVRNPAVIFVDVEHVPNGIKATPSATARHGMGVHPLPVGATGT